MSRSRSKSSALASLVSTQPVHRRQLTKLGYYDLFLVHSPHDGRDGRLARYRALLEAKNRGLVRTVGVSNLCVAITFERPILRDVFLVVRRSISRKSRKRG